MSKMAKCELIPNVHTQSHQINWQESKLKLRAMRRFTVRVPEVVSQIDRQIDKAVVCMLVVNPS